MRRTQRPWGSGNTTPTGEGDVSHEGAGADVPGGWPVPVVVPREDLGQRRVGEGGEDGRLPERRTKERVTRGRRGTDR